MTTTNDTTAHPAAASTRLRDAMSDIPARCGYCRQMHPSTACPDMTAEDVATANEHDAAMLAKSHTLDPIVRCAECGIPTHERRSAFWTRDTHETICNECGHEDMADMRGLETRRDGDA